MTDLTKLTLVESIKHVKEKKCSASELVSAYVKRIEKSDKLNCFNTKDLENAVSKAKKIDANKKLDKDEKVISQFEVERSEFVKLTNLVNKL